MQRAATIQPVPLTSRAVEHLPAISVVALTAMTVVAHLVPCDTAAAQWHNVAPIMLWLLLLGGWALAAVLRGHATLVFDRTTFLVLALTLLPGLSATYLCWTESGNCRLALNLSWQWASFGVMFFLARQWLKSIADVRMLTAIMIAIATGLSVFALVQFSILMPQTRLDFQRDPEGMLRAAGLDPTGDPAQLKHFKDRLDSPEPTATFALTNSLAGLLTPWLVVLCGLPGGALFRQPRYAWRLVLPAFLVAAALVLTRSRTAYLATFIGACLTLLCNTPLGRRINWRMLTMIGLLCTAAAIGGVVSGVLDVDVLKDSPKSVLFRLQYWQATAQIIRQFPLVGAGPGNFQDTYKWFQLPEASENIADPHNFILEVWATGGTPALLACVGLTVTLALRVRRIVQPSQSPASPSILTAPFRAHAVGAITGVMIGYGCGFLADVMPAFVLLLTGFPVAALTLWLLKPWVAHGEISSSLLVAALIALLINLLAAGGISFPGVSTSVWLLIAMVLVLTEPGPRMDAVAAGERALSRAGAFGWLLVAVLAGILYHTTVYNPVYRSTAMQSEATLAARSGRINDAIASAVKAAELDPASPQPWMSVDPQLIDLTDLWFSRLVNEGNTNALRTEFEFASTKASELDPRSAGTQTQLGHWSLALYRQFGEADDLAAARYHYTNAVARYPNNALVHAQLAWALHLGGDDKLAAVEAQTALELDGRHDHSELKLAKLRIYDIKPSPERNQPPPPPELSAEPIVLRLRKASYP